MSALMMFERAPIGAMISWSDGKTRPPASEADALAAWALRNGRGRLARKGSHAVMGQVSQPAGFTVMVDGAACDGGTDEPEIQTFSIESDLGFAIVKRPPVGACRIFASPGEDAELLHVASSQSHAETWVNNFGTRHTVIIEVTADEVAADHIEGRVAA